MSCRQLCFVFILISMLIIQTGLRGDTSLHSLEISVSAPDGEDQIPCVVICPGRGYHKDLPLIKDLASRLNEEGFATVCFNWSFFTGKLQPSEDGSKELADIDTAIRIGKEIPGVDSTRVYLVGKSLGSVYGYHAFLEHPELKACLLYTPIIPQPDLGSAYYPGLRDETRPLTFILGDQDRDNCPLGSLYAYLAGSVGEIPVVVLTGGHSFEINSDYNDPVNIQNTKTAIEMGVYWLKKM